MAKVKNDKYEGRTNFTDDELDWSTFSKEEQAQMREVLAKISEEIDAEIDAELDRIMEEDLDEE